MNSKIQNKIDWKMTRIKQTATIHLNSKLMNIICSGNSRLISDQLHLNVDIWNK